MKDVFYMAWRYLRYNRIKTFVLVLSISLILFLPIGLHVVVRQAAEMLTSRATSTPLLVGAKGSATDLVLSALYFKEANTDPVTFSEIQHINESGMAVAIPLHLRYTAREHRIVGTSVEYAAYRNLDIAEGRLFTILGECILGSRTCQSLDAGVGDYVLSTPAGAFDVGGSFPLKMKVVGVFAPSGTPDDDAVFVDIKTSWVISGRAHGHMDVTQPEAESGVLKREEGNVVTNASVLSYTEITPENMDTFHFHGAPSHFPVDMVLVFPEDRKAGILLRGRYEERTDPVQALVPLDVMHELLETVFSVRDYIITAGIGVGISTVLTMVLVFTLSIRLRRREIETIRKIGGTRRRLLAILTTEIILVVTAGILLSGILTLVVRHFGATLVMFLAS